MRTVISRDDLTQHKPFDLDIEVRELPALIG